MGVRGCCSVGVVLLLWTLAWPVQATIDPPSSQYTVVGFSPDGQHAYFKKEWSGGGADVQETWLAVFSVAQRKRLESRPIFRGGSDADETRLISKRRGARTQALLEKKYGKPAATRPLTLKKKNTLAGQGLTLTLQVKGKLPRLSEAGADLERDSKLRARLTLTIQCAQGEKHRTLWRKRIWLKPGPHPGGHMYLVWQMPRLTAGQLSLDGNARRSDTVQRSRSDIWRRKEGLTLRS